MFLVGSKVSHTNGQAHQIIVVLKIIGSDNVKVVTNQTKEIDNLQLGLSRQYISETMLNGRGEYETIKSLFDATLLLRF